MYLPGEEILSPEFLSIEEYLGRNTTAYYEVLHEVAEGRMESEPGRPAWLEFA